MRIALRPAVLLLVLAASRYAMGDGIPVDRVTGTIRTAYTTLTLTVSQEEEMEVLGTVTLTPDQWRRLREVTAACPKRFEHVVPLSYDLCTCELGNYAILLDSKRVAVLHNMSLPPHTSPHMYGRLYLRVGSKGDIFCDGSALPVEAVERRLVPSGWERNMAKKENTSQEREVVIHIPHNVDRTSPDIEKTLGKINSIAGKHGWQVDIYPKQYDEQ